MAGSTDPSPASSGWGAYSSLTQTEGQRRQSFPLQEQPTRSLRTPSGQDGHDGSESGSEYNGGHDSRDYRVTFMDDDQEQGNGHDEDDEDEDEDLDDMEDFAPLASSKRYTAKSLNSSSSSSQVSHPYKILAAVFGTAMIVSLVFALLSLLNLNGNNSLDKDRSNIKNQTGSAPAEPDNRVLKPPAGISIDEFKLSDFKLPPWDWDINTFVPINITNGPKFTRIQWQNGEQYLAVDCPQQQNYRYHFPSFPVDEFQEYPVASQGVADLLPLGQEPYVFVLCPPGNNNANVVFREFEPPGGNDEDKQQPPSTPQVPGTKEAPQPILDDVVMILVDAISRAKFVIEMKTVMETFQTINSASPTEGHRIFDFEHNNVLGQNSPPNKAFIYAGQSIENLNRDPKHWVWDVFEEQGFTTAHTDGECGGERGIHDYTSGAITFEYSHENRRIPAQYQMPQPVWCENHDMHVVSNVWGQSCTLPAGVDYDRTLMGGMRWNTPYCAGEKAIHEHIMENLEGWLASTKGKRRFATYSFMDTHSPDHHHISFDKRLATFIQNLLVGTDGKSPLLSPRSALVIMADHGLHYGRETFTFPGFIHHKIPPLYVALPNQLLTERPSFLQAVEENSKNRIVSHLDLHQTFLHIAYGDFPVDGAEPNAYAEFMTKFIADGTFRRQFHPQAPNETSYAQTFGRSLLLPIEESRTCRTGGIPNDFCAFQPFLDLDPTQEVDATFMRGALILLSKQMNDLAASMHVNDVCRPYSLNVLPLSPATSSPAPAPTVNATFDDIGTEDLVMESAYASAATSRVQQQVPGVKSETRVFYFMVRDRHQPNRKYSITMREDEIVQGIGDSITIQQMSAYAAAWHPCAMRISQGGKAIGQWQNVVKHFCVC
ncbi:hypothetical protein BGZ50_009689 [Haplosporangium sp. Z 11]|nr:hypothetical protein BGZ50_009689 [Haplosporangium sp. Z 11]